MKGRHRRSVYPVYPVFLAGGGGLTNYWRVGILSAEGEGRSFLLGSFEFPVHGHYSVVSEGW